MAQLRSDPFIAAWSARASREASIGEGIPLIAPRHRSVPLTLRSSRKFTDGVVRLHYSVERQPRSRHRTAGA